MAVIINYHINTFVNDKAEKCRKHLVGDVRKEARNCKCQIQILEGDVKSVGDVVNLRHT